MIHKSQFANPTLVRKSSIETIQALSATARSVAITPRGLPAGVACARVMLASEPVMEHTASHLNQAARLLARLETDMAAVTETLAAADMPPLAQ